MPRGQQPLTGQQLTPAFVFIANDKLREALVGATVKSYFVCRERNILVSLFHGQIALDLPAKESVDGGRRNVPALKPEQGITFMQTQLQTPPVSAKNAKTVDRKTKRQTKDKEPKSKQAKSKQTKIKRTKAAQILGLLRRKGGVTINELCKTTGWQAHSVRGFLSGTVRRKLGLKVSAETNDKGIRRYWIEGTPDKAGA